MQFAKITQQGDTWNSWDSLNGKKIADGTRLHIKWPDGAFSVEAVKVGKSFVVGLIDPNTHTATVKTVEFAYVSRFFHGVQTWVHVRGLLAKPSRVSAKMSKKK